MSKVLGQSGRSLADLYDVQGSIAGIEQLDTRELTIVHETGATIFSERFSTFIRRSSSGTLIQNTAWNVIISDLPSGPYRILGISVIADAQGCVSLASLSLREHVTGRETPVHAWDSVSDSQISIRWSDDGTAAVTAFLLRPNTADIPHITAGRGQPQMVRDLVFRGLTSGFGAGGVAIIALIHVAFSEVGGLSSFGLPIPSW